MNNQQKWNRSNSVLSSSVPCAGCIRRVSTSSPFLLCKRNYSNISVHRDFGEWLAGFIDAEGSFIIRKDKKLYSFVFEIGLHKDDTSVLKDIYKTLGIGIIGTVGQYSYFRVTKQKELFILREILEGYPLNSTKYLNDLAFYQALVLYTKTRTKTSELLDEILTIKNSMNTNRSNFELPKSKDFRITPNWFVGFLEGDGSFSILRDNLSMRFNIWQAKCDLALLEAIKDFINNLPGDYKSRRKTEGVVTLTVRSAAANANTKALVSIGVSNTDFIQNVFIPFLDTLLFRTKKGKAYYYWKTVLSLKKLGLHYTDEGLKIIGLIINKMNSLTSNPNSADTLDSEVLQNDINRLLSGPSNLEIQEDGRIFIKSLNKYYSDKSKIKVELHNELGLVISTWDSIADCAKYLGITRQRAGTLLQKGSSVRFEDKVLYIKKVIT